MKLLIAGLVLMWPAFSSAQQLDVHIIGRQDSDIDYSYVVPGHFTSYSSSNGSLNANCSGLTTGSISNTDCNGSTQSTTTVNGVATPAQEVSFHVRGATLTLQLPDGRVAVVNCTSKFHERFAGPRGNHRDCRVPLVDELQADFHGDNAKLEWNVSLDGRKIQSETYKIVAVLGRPTDKADKTPASLTQGQAH